VIAERGSSFLPPGASIRSDLALSDPRSRLPQRWPGGSGRHWTTLSYPITTGWDVAKILRLADSAQFLAASRWATPADSKRGDDVIVVSACATSGQRRSIQMAGMLLRHN
jgi:hypothetical protein